MASFLECFIVSFHPDRTALTPYSTSISLILAIPALFAAICALMSPDAADGSLKLESMIERSSWSIFPLFTSFTGGIITPSWYRFFAFGFRLPNTGPPTSTM